MFWIRQPTENFKYMYIHLLCMATKSITITSEAYERLTVFKESNESFSDVINKLTKRDSLLDLVGVLSPKEAEELEASVNESRKRMRKRMDETAARLR